MSVVRTDDLQLHIPRPEDGWFYVKMMSDPETMAYNAPWFPPDGCIPEPESEWLELQASWIGKEPERFYAFLQRKSDGAFVGDVNYHENPEHDRCDMGIVIYAPERGKRYGKQGLRLLLDRAFSVDGVSRLYNDFETARDAAYHIHRAVGFRKIGTADGIVRLELTREEYLYRELGALTGKRDEWGDRIPYAASLLSSESVKIKAKALWLLGEMGLAHPDPIREYVPAVASFLDSGEPLLRERAVNALGRIGRSNYPAIEPYWADLFRFARDTEAKVRLSFIWASENIAVNMPDLYENSMHLFAELLYDRDERVRMEAPEIFRVLGRRRPDFVEPYVGQLRAVSETDENRVVRIHCLGAIKAAGR